MGLLEQARGPVQNSRADVAVVYARRVCGVHDVSVVVNCAWKVCMTNRLCILIPKILANEYRIRKALAGRRHADQFITFARFRTLLLPLDFSFKFGKGLLRVLSFDV